MQNAEKRIAELEKKSLALNEVLQLNAPWLDMKNLILRNSSEQKLVIKKDNDLPVRFERLGK